MPQFILFNLRGEKQYKKGEVTRRLLGQFWARGKDEKIPSCLNESRLYYQSLANLVPLEKYEKMVNFALEKSRIFKAVMWGKIPLFRFAKGLAIIFFILCLISFVFLVYSFFSNGNTISFNVLGILIVSLTLSITFKIFYLFISILCN